ncbi:MAG: hypothetical protein QOH14_206 [Pseudonocardiales bacterium]|jgi:hypothetical protein|nr:hypothetical protein [Pseudonocardiales bacterium]
MIDIVDALDLLDSCVRDRGAGFRSPRRRGSAAAPRGRYYSCPAARDSIVNLALIKAGVPQPALSRLASKTVADVYASGLHPLDLTLGAVVVLRAAESKERRGHAWGSCLQAALQAASRFIELIPDGVVRCAAEAAAD